MTRQCSRRTTIGARHKQLSLPSGAHTRPGPNQWPRRSIKGADLMVDAPIHIVFRKGALPAPRAPINRSQSRVPSSLRRSPRTPNKPAAFPSPKKHSAAIVRISAGFHSGRHTPKTTIYRRLKKCQSRLRKIESGNSKPALCAPKFSLRDTHCDQILPSLCFVPDAFHGTDLEFTMLKTAKIDAVTQHFRRCGEKKHGRIHFRCQQNRRTCT